MNRAPSPSPSLPLIAIAATSVFLLIVVVLHFVQAGHYHPLSQAVSELALGRAGWLMAIAFCSLGTASLLVARILRQISTHPRVGPALLAIAGLLSFVSAFVHADGNNGTTTHGRIHQAVGIATFILIIAAMFSLVRAFRRDADWQPLATPTLIWAFAGIGGFFLIPISGNAYFGVAQRIFLGVLLGWQVAVSLHAHRAERRLQTSSRVPPAGPRRRLDPWRTPSV